MTDTNVDIPESLIALAKEGKPTSYAEGLVDYCKADISRALNYDLISSPRGGMLSMDSLMASIKLEVATNERVAEAMIAAPSSFAKAVILAAQCKLLVGQSHGLFYLIPRWSKKLGTNEITPLIGYKGLTDLAYRHPRIHKVDAILVFEGDEWDYDAGSGKLTHKVKIGAERDEDHIVGGYARVVITEPAGTHPVLDDPVVHVMSRKQLMQVKERSDAWQQAEKSARQKGWTPRSPWHTDPLPMHRKTLIRAVMNGGSVPKDMGIGAVIAADDAAQMSVEEVRPPTIPSLSRSEGLRKTLGIDEPAEPFDFAEEAVEAMRRCETMEEMHALKDRMQHFKGGDADQVAQAWEINEERINGG